MCNLGTGKRKQTFYSLVQVKNEINLKVRSANIGQIKQIKMKQKHIYNHKPTKRNGQPSDIT